ncbi:hypothetical protein A0H81_01453 [Grifola frondosa]|uniref:BHLH domain-containing protein n=1 Tax=Grifola frondosa TaxID=5627 RepID=A0A1C7MS07_GRIFR|nr:hypothetical protein A0H81_01453 [Grifola frondosa]
MSRSTPHSPPHHPPVHPPVPFDDFQFVNPTLHNLLPSSPPLPSSVDLFSPSETTDFFGFLENFNWEFDSEPYHASGSYLSPHIDPSLTEPSQLPSQPVTVNGKTAEISSHSQVDTKPEARARSDSASSSDSTSSRGTPSGSSAPPRVKPLLSTPQKRLNHIISPLSSPLQVLLLALACPPEAGRRAAAAVAEGVKGKSGILFRAREYIRWLEDGREALLEEYCCNLIVSLYHPTLVFACDSI